MSHMIVIPNLNMLKLIANYKQTQIHKQIPQLIKKKLIIKVNKSVLFNK